MYLWENCNGITGLKMHHRSCRILKLRNGDITDENISNTISEAGQDVDGSTFHKFDDTNTAFHRLNLALNSLSDAQWPEANVVVMH